MGLVAAQHQRTARPSVISPSDQARADRGDERLKRRSLHRDRPNYVHIPLDLGAQHNAFVVVLIQALHLSDWPGCTFFAVAVEKIRRCCSATDVERSICERVDRIIGHFYPQVTINVPRRYAKRVSLHLPNPGERCPGTVGKRWTTNVKSSRSLLALKQISIENESTTAAQRLAETLTKKISNGIQEIRTYLEKSSLPHYFSGTSPTELKKAPRQICSSHASYDDIERSFSEEASEYTRNGDESRFLAWCFGFSAGTTDSIAHRLPRRSVTGEEPTQISKRSHPQTRKRRRDLSCLVNFVVHRLPGKPRIIYIALGGK